MTKKELIAAASGMPILNIPDFLLDQFKAVGRVEKIGENGQNWAAYRVGSIVCVNGPRCPLTEAVSERAYIPGKYADDSRTPEDIIQKTGLAIKIKRGFKTWGWLAEKVIESELTGRPLKSIFRPYNQYGGKWASRSYYKIPEGLNEACARLGLTYELKNDAPRGGKAGDYLEFRKAEK